MDSNDIYKVILDQREELPFLVEGSFIYRPGKTI